MKHKSQGTRSKFATGGLGGGAHFECVRVSQLEGSGVLWDVLEMAGNAFKTNRVWWNFYTFSNEKVVF